MEATPEELVKVNDGASAGNPGKDRMGGIVRDKVGLWLGGFSVGLGAVTNIQAELCAILKGLQLVCENGYRKVIIDLDSKVGMKMIEEVEETSPYYNVVQQIRVLKVRNGHIA